MRFVRSAAASPSAQPPQFVTVVFAAALAVILGAIGSAHAQNAASSNSGEQPAGAASPSIEFPHPPRLVVQVIPSSGVAPLTVGFLVSNTNPQSSPIVSYRWTFGDGQFSTLPPTLFFHTYVNPGSYVIEVTGTTADGLNATGVAGVVVRAGP